MSTSRDYYVYIVASLSRVLYIGVTNDLIRRSCEHREKFVKGFASRYHCTRLVHYEQTSDVLAAIEREKQIKAWRREKKMALIEADNPQWNDLYLSLTRRFLAALE